MRESLLRIPSLLRKYFFSAYSFRTTPPVPGIVENQMVVISSNLPFGEKKTRQSTFHMILSNSDDFNNEKKKKEGEGMESAL